MERDIEATSATVIRGEVVVADHWWWMAASVAQSALGYTCYRISMAGSCSMMPVRAFFISSIYLGSAASVGMASLRASGLHTVEDMKVLGENIRTAMNAPPPRSDMKVVGENIRTEINTPTPRSKNTLVEDE